MRTLRFRLSLQREAERSRLLAPTCRLGGCQVPRPSRGRTTTLRFELVLSFTNGRYPQRLLPIELEEGLHRRFGQDQGRKEGDRASKAWCSALRRHHPQSRSAAEEWVEKPEDRQELEASPRHRELLSFCLGDDKS